MMGLPDRESSLTISAAVWIQYTNVTDGRISDDSKNRAYPWRRAVILKRNYKQNELQVKCYIDISW